MSFLPEADGEAIQEPRKGSPEKLIEVLPGSIEATWLPCGLHVATILYGC